MAIEISLEAFRVWNKKNLLKLEKNRTAPAVATSGRSRPTMLGTVTFFAENVVMRRDG